MNLRLTTLCDNLAASVGFVAEWGLSILIEYGKDAVLLDTGMTDTVLRNADSAGVDLSRIGTIVISHGHMDHTGGLRGILQHTRKKIRVVMHPDAWLSKYAQRPQTTGNRNHYVGIPYARAELENLGAQFTLSREPVWITDRILSTGEVPMETKFESIDTNLFVKAKGAFQPDALPDDQALVIKTDKGLVVVLGCAHRGMVNTLMHARTITGEERIHAVVGGTHLFRANADQLDQTIAALTSLGVAHIGVSHCTGMPAAISLREHFPDRFFFNHAGKVVEF
jgi:7,8-dihydropterin-6-yl-methyl-4-(beta-D-ribofuranosyl)aminobenzene 5'-phosphate synthase